MGTFLQNIIKSLPLQTILGWIFPQVGTALANYQANKTPDNGLLLLEALANAGAGYVAPAILPKLLAVEGTLSPLLDSGIAFEQAPGIGTAKPLAAALLVTIEVFVPGISTVGDLTAKWLDDTAALAVAAGLKLPQ